MTKEGQEPLSVVPRREKSRRLLLKSAMLVLGAGAIIQPSGGVLGLTQDTPKKEGGAKVHSTVKTTDVKKKPVGKKKGRKKEETPKKEGG